MDSDTLRLAKAHRLIDALQREKFRLEKELRTVQLELRRLRRAIAVLQAKEPADASA